MKDKVILITGVSRGIGEYLANYYAGKGLKVIGCSRSKVDIASYNFEHVVADVSNEQQVINLFKMIKSKYGKLDYLINNAAINPAIISAALLKSETIQTAFATNVFSMMYCCREAVKMMSRKKVGRIINIGSMAIKHEVEGEALYTSTKSANLAYSRVLAKELGKTNITVNVVSPSVIKTDLSSQIDKKAIENILTRNAIRDFGQFADVANVIDFLLQDSSSSITGQHIYLGGV